LNGVETLKSGAVMATTKASIRIRPRVVTTAMRAVVGVTEFNIINVLPDEQNKDFIDLACEVFT
jgi:head-tail adaptor